MWWQAFHGAQVHCVDSSPEMLEHARKAMSRECDVSFEHAHIETFTVKEPVDVIFANASLHWVKRHEELYPRLLGLVNHGGVLAAQVWLRVHGSGDADCTHCRFRTRACSRPICSCGKPPRTSGLETAWPVCRTSQLRVSEDRESCELQSYL